MWFRKIAWSFTLPCKTRKNNVWIILVNILYLLPYFSSITFDDLKNLVALPSNVLKASLVGAINVIPSVETVSNSDLMPATLIRQKLCGKFITEIFDMQILVKTRKILFTSTIIYLQYLYCTCMNCFSVSKSGLWSITCQSVN